MRAIPRTWLSEPGSRSWTSFRMTSVSAARLEAFFSLSWPVATKSFVIVGMDPVCAGVRLHSCGWSGRGAHLQQREFHCVVECVGEFEFSHVADDLVGFFDCHARQRAPGLPESCLDFIAVLVSKVSDEQ